MSSAGGHSQVRHGGDPTERQNEAVLQSKRASGSRFWGSPRGHGRVRHGGDPTEGQGPKMSKINTENNNLEPVSAARPARGRKCPKSVLKVAISNQFLRLGQPGAENAQNQY